MCVIAKLLSKSGNIPVPKSHTHTPTHPHIHSGHGGPGGLELSYDYESGNGVAFTSAEASEGQSFIPNSIAVDGAGADFGAGAYVPTIDQVHSNPMSKPTPKPKPKP